MGGEIERVSDFFQISKNKGGKKRRFIGGHTALPTILPSGSLRRNELKD